MDKEQMKKILDFLFKRWNSNRFFKFSAINLFIAKDRLIMAELFSIYGGGACLPFIIEDRNFMKCCESNDNILKQLIDMAEKTNVKLGSGSISSNFFIYKGETLEELLVKADLEDV